MPGKWISTASTQYLQIIVPARGIIAYVYMYTAPIYLDRSKYCVAVFDFSGLLGITFRAVIAIPR